MGERAACLIGSPIETERVTSNDVAWMQRILFDEQLGQCDRAKSVVVASATSSTDVIQAVDRAFSNVGHGGEVIFYYSGHGDFNNSGRFCLRLNPDNSGLLPVAWIRDSLDNHQVRRALIIFDACFGGAAIDQMVTAKAQRDAKVEYELKSLELGESIAIIASSNDGEVSWPAPQEEIRYSVFTLLHVPGDRRRCHSLGSWWPFRRPLHYRSVPD